MASVPDYYPIPDDGWDMLEEYTQMLGYSSPEEALEDWLIVVNNRDTRMGYQDWIVNELHIRNEQIEDAKD